MRMLVAILAALILIAGCSSVPLRIPSIENRDYEVLGQAEGSSTGIMLFQFIPINQNERFENAYRQAVLSRGGDAMLDPVIEERWFWAYILNGYTTTVRGTVIRYKR